MMSKRIKNTRSESGLGMMEVIIGVLATLIIGFVMLHLVRMGYAMYSLNNVTNQVAEKLEIAKARASGGSRPVAVIFSAADRKFGIDRNGNGKLESIEADELPEGISLSEDAIVIFKPDGRLHPDSRAPEIIVSNARDARAVRVSSMGSIEID